VADQHRLCPVIFYIVFFPFSVKFFLFFHGINKCNSNFFELIILL